MILIKIQLTKRFSKTDTSIHIFFSSNFTKSYAVLAKNMFRSTNAISMAIKKPDLRSGIHLFYNCIAIAFNDVISEKC